MSESKIVGALFFCVGLFFIVSYKLNLYTGKIGYLIDNDRSYIKEMLITLIGNFIGTLLTATLLNFTRLDFSKVNNLVNSKLSDSYLSIFILSLFCGGLMYLGVEGYKRFETSIGKHLAVFLAVMVFILSGYEHCVANMFYFSLTNKWLQINTYLYAAVMILGNSVGSLAISCGFKYLKRETL